jgi:two-component system, NarL family, nitrate/nitrite response regulator NarL
VLCQRPPEGDTGPIRVLIVEDHRVVAEGLASLLQDCADIQLVGFAGTVSEAVRLAEEYQPGVVLMDARLGDGSGMDAAIRIRQRQPRTAVLFLSADDSDEAMLAAVEAGACGYLSKAAAGSEVVAAVRTAAQGGVLVSSQRVANLLGLQRASLAREARRAQLLGDLTPREREVLRMLARGLDNREVGRQLGIGYATVRSHVRKVLEKIGARTRLEAVVRATEQGLLDRP